jgi:phage shock protein A
MSRRCCRQPNPANDNLGQQVHRLPEVISKMRSRRKLTMLQTSEIQKRFGHLQQTISEASRTLHADKSAPKDLMDCMDELDKECQSAQQAMSSQDEDLIRQCIDDMEEIGDRAERACEQAAAVDGKVKRAVSTMHSELSDLKRQVH